MRNSDFYSLRPFFSMMNGIQSLLPLQIRSYLEIGVNKGLSLRRVFRRYPEMERVVLCDKWSYKTATRKLVESVIIDESFPLDRVTFLDGDSREQIPKFFRKNPHMVFDVVFVDGGHSPPCLRADLRNVDTHARVIVVHDIRCTKKPFKGSKKRTRLSLVVDRFFEHRRERLWQLITETDSWGTAVLIDAKEIRKIKKAG